MTRPPAHALADALQAGDVHPLEALEELEAWCAEAEGALGGDDDGADAASGGDDEAGEARQKVCGLRQNRAPGHFDRLSTRSNENSEVFPQVDGLR